MRSTLLLLYKYLSLIRRQQQANSGFTLIELLVSVIMSSIIILALMLGVVEFATIDRRETLADQIQRDMNRAMEYITDDLKEAVYVYQDPQQIANEITGDPNFPDNAGEVPVLAFWRIDPIEDNLPSCNAGTPEFIRECERLRIRQAAYTLVVYSQKDNDGNGNWLGQSRIVRYELSMYDDLPTLTKNDGYRDPTDSEDDSASFGSWEADGVPNAGSPPVLVDYVQSTSAGAPLNRAPLNDAGGPCRAYGLDRNNNPLYAVSPSTATVATNNSFFACVRNPSLDAGGNGNQDVYLFLRGNIQGEAGVVRTSSDRSSLPILETQVVVKGVVDKGFRQ